MAQKQEASVADRLFDQCLVALQKGSLNQVKELLKGVWHDAYAEGYEAGLNNGQK